MRMVKQNKIVLVNGWAGRERDCENIYEVGKGVTSATTLDLSNLTRYISATWKATIRYIIVSR